MTKKSDIVEIEKALDQASEKVRRASINTEMLKKFALFFPLILLVATGLYLSFSPKGTSDKAERKPHEETAKEASYLSELKNVTEVKDFNWTVDRYDAIVVSDIESQSPSLKDISEKYGLADTYEESEDVSDGRSIVVATYYGEDYVQNVTFRFIYSDGIYRLYSKNFAYLPDDTYPVATDEKFKFNWNQEQVDTLALGQKPDEIVADYGLPTDASQVAFDSFRQLIFVYQEDNDPTSTVNSVQLNFTQDEFGEFVLTSKEGVFRD